MKIAIDKASLAALPRVEYDGNIHVIDAVSDVRAAVEALRKHKIVGFDTETRPSFRKGKTNKVALIQVATPHECFLFRTNVIGIPERLAQYLADADCLKIGLSLHDDFNMLDRRAKGDHNGFIDLQHIVGDYCICDISLQKVYAIIFGGRISKAQRLTNWEAETLTPAQMTYAAIDAWACLEIYNYLMAGKFNPETSPYIVKDENDQI